MKAEHYVALLTLVSATVETPTAVAAGNNASHVKDKEENISLFHPEQIHYFYESLPLSDSDDKVTVNINLQGDSTVEASGYNTRLEDQTSLRTSLVPISEEQGDHAFPIVSKHGTLYYDISQVKEVEVVIERNNMSVEGVTATREHGPCLVETLVLKHGYILDEDISINCNLKNLTLKGGNWLCIRDWNWLQGLGQVVDYKRAMCIDIFCYQHFSSPDITLVCSFKEGLNKVSLYNIPRCPEVCSRCTWYVPANFVKVSYICNNANLTDAMLPDLPESLTSLSLEGNKIRSTKKLFERLKNTRMIEVLYLGMNELDTFPYLDSDIFSKLIDIYLNDNQMKQFELEAIQTLLAKKDSVITLRNNPWRCGCNAYLFTQLILKYYREPILIQDMQKLRCYMESSNKSIPLWFVNGDGCVPKPFMEYWAIINVVLGLLNVVMMYIIVDLTLILTNFKGWKSTKRPKLDIAVCWVKGKVLVIASAIKRAQKGAKEEGEEEEEEECKSSFDKEVTIRNHNRSSMYRRRTPLPTMD